MLAERTLAPGGPRVHVGALRLPLEGRRRPAARRGAGFGTLVR